MQISNSYCGNIKNSKAGLQTFISLLKKEHINYEEEDILCCINLMSGLCPKLSPKDINFITKLIYSYNKLKILKNCCPWIFPHSIVQLKKYEYDQNRWSSSIYHHANLNNICYYHKGIFIMCWRSEILMINIQKGMEQCFSKKLVSSSMEDLHHFYFQEGQLYMRKTCVHKKMPTIKFNFTEDNAFPDLEHCNDSENITSERHLSIDEIKLMDVDNLLLYDKSNVMITNDIIIEFNENDNYIKVFKIL